MICQSLALVANLWSFHTAFVPNQNTFGAGIECRNEFTYQAGMYRNSYNLTSVYAAVGKDWEVAGFRLGGFGGIVTGYHGITSIAGLSASHKLYGPVSIGVQAIPGIYEHCAIFHVTLSADF